jgi:hypothetical protein
MPAPWLQIQLGQHTAIDLPERIDRKVLAQLKFEGVSAAMMPDGTVLYNEAADSALHASRREAAAEATASHHDGRASNASNGLVLIHSHAHRGEQFALYARMLELTSMMELHSPTRGINQGQRASVLHGLSLLIIKNDAGQKPGRSTNYNSSELDPEHPSSWLRLFKLGSMRLRMIILTHVNLGYKCGEFHSLFAASKILSLFPWVLYTSGPDNLPTPYGIFRISSLLANARERGPGRLLADHFQGSSRQLSLDLFVYELPAEDVRAAARSTTACDRFWWRLVEACLGHGQPQDRGGTRMPEPMLAAAARTAGLPVVRLGNAPICAGYKSRCVDWNKIRLNAPLFHSVVWHAHNSTKASRWLDEQEDLWRLRKTGGATKHRSTMWVQRNQSDHRSTAHDGPVR